MTSEAEDAPRDRATLRVSLRYQPPSLRHSALLACGFLGALASTFFGPGPVNTRAPVLLAIMTVVGLGALWLRTDAIHVGADGIYLGRLWMRRFIRGEQIAAVEAVLGALEDDAWESRREGGINLFLRNGELIHLPLVGRREQVPLVLERIRRLRDAHRSDGDELRALERGDRTIAEWRRALKEVAKPRDFRTARIAPDELDRVMIDATARDDQRLGAALALASSKDPTAKQRIRVAASAMAAPNMRAALEHMAADQEVEAEVEQAIERALGDRPKRPV